MNWKLTEAQIKTLKDLEDWRNNKLKTGSVMPNIRPNELKAGTGKSFKIAEIINKQINNEKEERAYNNSSTKNDYC